MVIKMNVPKLRFKEFKEEWKKNKLGHLCTFAKGNGLSKSDLSNEGKECILYGELYTTYSEIIRKINSYTDKDSSSFIYSKFNDVLIPASGETPIEIAKASCILKENVILGGDLNILSPKNMDGRFLAYQIGSSRKLEFANLSQGHSVVHLYGDKIKNVNIYYPSPKEQEKISNTLELLDKKIELQSKKIEALKLYKKGLENYYFNNLEECEKVKLGDICNITTGKLDANAMVKDGKYRFYTCASEYYFINNYAFDTEALLISGNGANVGYIHYYNGKFNAYQRTYVLDNFIKNIQYVKIYLEKYLPIHISLEKRNGNTPYITLSTIENMIIKIPSEIIIKKLINQIILFTNKIELEENKLLYLNKLKKGLMQNMFV